MKIAIMGSGGIGGYYGGRLARSGEDVTFIARGAHLDALRAGGLKVEHNDGEIVLDRVQATDRPADVGPVDLVLMSVKAYDLESAARAIKPLVGEGTAVLPLLNGVDIAERIGAVVGHAHMLGGLCYISSAIVAPGVVRQRGPLNRLLVGELDGSRSERAERAHAALAGAGIAAELSTAIVREIWTKFLFIDAASGVCALTGATLGPVLADTDVRALYVACLEEVAALAARLEVGLPDEAVANTLKLSDGLPDETKPSMLLDLQQGRKLEVEALNGTVARLGRERGVDTPVNRFIYAALKLRADGAPPAV